MLIHIFPVQFKYFQLHVEAEITPKNGVDAMKYYFVLSGN